MVDRLAALQSALQADIMGETTESLPLLSVPRDTRAEKRLFVYQNAYVSRLVEILGKDYDTTWTWLGDENFHALAQKFVRTHPSGTPNARWFGRRFPDFLRAEDLGPANPAVSEIAGIERALNDAFDAADAPPMTSEDLASMAGEGIEDMKLSLHPSAALLQMASNAHDILQALRAGGHPPDIAVSAMPRWVLVWRTDLTCRHMALDSEQGQLLDNLNRGAGFGGLCELSASIGGPDTAVHRMAGYLQQWINSGILASPASQADAAGTLDHP